MRRIRVVALALVVILALTISVSAATTATSVSRSLTFNGTTANCAANVIDIGKTINATMELWCGNVLLGVWFASGTSYVDLGTSLTVGTGMTYTLKVYGTVNGISFEAAPIVRSN